MFPFLPGPLLPPGVSPAGLGGPMRLLHQSIWWAVVRVRLGLLHGNTFQVKLSSTSFRHSRYDMWGRECLSIQVLWAGMLNGYVGWG